MQSDIGNPVDLSLRAKRGNLVCWTGSPILSSAYGGLPVEDDKHSRTVSTYPFQLDKLNDSY